MIKNIDYLIIYELKNREYETACLIKHFLEKKGYTVEITLGGYSLRKYFYNPKVILTPFFYKTKDSMVFNSFWTKKRRPVINMQYEQVLSESTDSAGYYNPKGEAQNVMYISWGENSTKRLREQYKLDNNHITQTGNLSVVLNDPIFKSIYFEKRDIGEKFNLDSNAEWHMFISSFTYSTLNKEELDRILRDFPDEKDFYEIMIKSRPIVLEWLESYCIKNPNKEVIYRLHPHEYLDKTLEDMQNRLLNFHCIRDLSIRQWIFVADTFSTWFSTSVVDLFFSKKKFVVLRPINIPQRYEVDILKGYDFVSNKDLFLSLLDGNKTIGTLDIKYVSRFYDNADALDVIDRFVNCCEYVLNNSEEYEVSFRKRSRLIDLICHAIMDIARHIPIYKCFNNRYTSLLKIYYFNSKSVKKLSKEYKKMFEKI